MRWPWQRFVSSDTLIVSWSGQVFSFVRGRASADGQFEVRQFGVERQGDDSLEDFVKRLQALGLKGLTARAMLRPEQYQMLQIDAPAVAPEELRSAARYQIRDLLAAHTDDITIDVMKVGDGQEKGTPHLFVVAATNAVVRTVLELGDAMQWKLSVIDIQEMAQRNVQTLLAKRDARVDRATAALVLGEGPQAVLTISANEELYYTRRLELPDGFMTGAWRHSVATEQPLNDAYAPVEEYVPDYGRGDVSLGDDFGSPAGGGPRSSASATNEAAEQERAQRFLVEVQRSLDLWDRSWSSMPLAGLSVYAGERTDELVQWLSAEMGQTVKAMDVDAMFTGFTDAAATDMALCWPLLGALLRTESRKL
jgi:MSHA biogenesis protein MshI